MIKHEEVRDIVSWVEHISITDKQILFNYIIEQEKKDELLELYRECNKEGYFWLEIQQRIRALEEELK